MSAEAVPSGDFVADLPCADCGYPARPTTARTLAKGSSVRDPGEALCAGCSSSRTRLVKAVMALPNTLDQIKALRMGSPSSGPDRPQV